MSNRTQHPMVEPDELEEIFEALDALQASGTTNMVAAPSWLRENFELTKDESQFAFEQWAASKSNG